MRLAKSIVGIFILASSPLLGQTGQDKKSRRDPWTAFEAGSWVVFQETRTLNAKGRESKTKHLLVKHEEEGPRLALILEEDGRFVEPTKTSIRPQGGLPADSQVVARRQDTITIGDLKLACAVTEYEIEDKKGDFKAKLALWRNNERTLPYREIPTSAGNPPALLEDTVRAEYFFQYRAASVKYTVAVVDFARILKLGGRDISCVVEKIAFEEMTKDKSFQGEGVRWLSAEVPGQEVKFVLKGTSNGVPLQVEKTVVDFKGRRRPS